VELVTYGVSYKNEDNNSLSVIQGLDDVIVVMLLRYIFNNFHGPTVTYGYVYTLRYCAEWKK